MTVIGSSLSYYRIDAKLGAGGMGEVYRATDTRLGREVAIKLLPSELAGDPERLARFEREAKLLASLNHPNIAHVYGFESATLQDGKSVHFLAMELVEGEDLAERLKRGAIPIDEALPIAKQIAEALEEAHERGIVHRDLKPANVKVASDGRLKVLDFGLAKASAGASAAGSGPELSQSPTLAHTGTQAGVILGTAAYMSPEQARGKKVDRRTDLWAFGCVLYELLSGRRLFGGEDVADTLGNVMKVDPDWSGLPVDTPAPIRRLLRRCLEKERPRRMADASDVRLELEEATSPSGSASTDEAGVRARVDAAVATATAQLLRAMRVRMAVVGVVAALLAVVATGSGMWFATRSSPPRVVQTTISTTAATALAIDGFDRDVAITPDGSRVVYVGNRSSELFVRPLDSLESVSLRAGASRGPFVSPDGQWVGFFDNIVTLKKLAITGGPPVTLVTSLDGGSRGAVWLQDDTIVFATNAGGTGLQQVSAGGGPVTVLTRPDRARGEMDHVWPEALPGGRAVLFTIVLTSGSVDGAQVAVFDRQTQTTTVVVRGGSHAHYVASGHLVYAAGGTLRGVAFDPATRTTRGASVPVVPDVVTTATVPAGGVDAAVAADGTLVYVRGRAAAAQRTLAWVDRLGRETVLPLPPRPYALPRVSPDGGRVLVHSSDQDSDLWLWDLTRLTLTRITFGPTLDYAPVWTPDGRRVLFTSNRDGAANMYVQEADGTGTAERLTTSPNQEFATSVTPDGTQLLFTELAPRTREDVMQVSLGGTATVTPLLQTPANERNGMVSPDGRWLAYEADESGQFETYVRPYPEVSSGRWQVSEGGGTQPLWSHDGRELFYVSPANALLRIGVERGAAWAATKPTLVLKDLGVRPGGAPRQNYDVSPDGQRFLVIKEAGEANATPPQLVVVQHFNALLERLVTGKSR